MPAAQYLPFFKYREAPAFFGEGEDYGGYFTDPDVPVSRLVRFPPKLRVVTATRFSDADDVNYPDTERPVFTQSVEEVEEYLFDFKDVLFAEDVIESASADVVRSIPEGAGELTISNVQRNDDQVGFFAGGGTAKASYEVRVVLSTYEGREIRRSIVIRVA